jgi:hypothetical protein
MPTALDAGAIKHYLAPWTADAAERRFVKRFQELADAKS